MIILDITRLTALLILLKMKMTKCGNRQFHKVISLPKVCAGILVSLAVILAGTFVYPGYRVTAPDSEYQFQYMLDKDLLVTQKEQSENTAASFENIRPGVVQIHVGNIYGGGTVWKITKDGIIIVSNRHVLEHFAAQARQDVNSNYVTFFDGEAARAELIGLSAEYDVGFVKVPLSELTYAQLCTLRSSRIDTEAYAGIRAGMTIFCVHSQDIIRRGPDDDAVVMDGKGTGIADQSYVGIISVTDAYIEDLGQNMIYSMCYAEPGMSGSGMFDGYGNLIGMVTGGTEQNEMISVPLSDILKVCRELGVSVQQPADR